MSITIQTSANFEQGLREEAHREGLSPSDHAALLLLIGRAITKEGRDTPFGNAVAEMLASRSLDVSRFASAVDDLMRICTHSANGESDLARGDEASPTLERWREVAVQVPPGTEIGLGTDFQTVLVELPDVGHPVQETGRRNRVSALGLFAHLPGGSEEFMARKQIEIELEDRRRS